MHLARVAARRVGPRPLLMLRWRGPTVPMTTPRRCFGLVGWPTRRPGEEEEEDEEEERARKGPYVRPPKRERRRLREVMKREERKVEARRRQMRLKYVGDPAKWKRVIAACDFWFGMGNLPKDDLMLATLARHDGWFPVRTLLSWPRLRYWCDMSAVLDALRDSEAKPGPEQYEVGLAKNDEDAVRKRKFGEVYEVSYHQRLAAGVDRSDWRRSTVPALRAANAQLGGFADRSPDLANAEWRRLEGDEAFSGGPERTRRRLELRKRHVDGVREMARDAIGGNFDDDPDKNNYDAFDFLEQPPLVAAIADRAATMRREDLARHLCRLHAHSVRALDKLGRDLIGTPDKRPRIHKALFGDAFAALPAAKAWKLLEAIPAAADLCASMTAEAHGDHATILRALEEDRAQVFHKLGLGCQRNYFQIRRGFDNLFDEEEEDYYSDDEEASPVVVVPSWPALYGLDCFRRNTPTPLEECDLFGEEKRRPSKKKKKTKTKEEEDGAQPEGLWEPPAVEAYAAELEAELGKAEYEGDLRRFARESDTFAAAVEADLAVSAGDLVASIEYNLRRRFSNVVGIGADPDNDIQSIDPFRLLAVERAAPGPAHWFNPHGVPPSGNPEFPWGGWGGAEEGFESGLERMYAAATEADARNPNPGYDMKKRQEHLLSLGLGGSLANEEMGLVWEPTVRLPPFEHDLEVRQARGEKKVAMLVDRLEAASACVFYGFDVEYAPPDDNPPPGKKKKKEAASMTEEGEVGRPVALVPTVLILSTDKVVCLFRLNKFPNQGRDWLTKGPVADFLRRESKVLVGHGAAKDAAALEAFAPGCRVRGVVDLKGEGPHAGAPKNSLKGLAKTYLGKELFRKRYMGKSGRRAARAVFWKAKELTKQMIRFAVHDVAAARAVSAKLFADDNLLQDEANLPDFLRRDTRVQVEARLALNRRAPGEEDAQPDAFDLRAAELVADETWAELRKHRFRDPDTVVLRSPPPPAPKKKKKKKGLSLADRVFNNPYKKGPPERASKRSRPARPPRRDSDDRDRDFAKNDGGPDSERRPPPHAQRRPKEDHRDRDFEDAYKKGPPHARRPTRPRDD